MQNDMAVEGNSNCKRKNNVQGNFLISERERRKLHLTPGKAPKNTIFKVRFGPIIKNLGREVGAQLSP